MSNIFMHLEKNYGMTLCSSRKEKHPVIGFAQYYKAFNTCMESMVAMLR